MQLYEEALAFRPRDPQLNQSAALLALEMDDLESAREYAEAACEADPAAVAHLRTLARVLRRSGDVEEARKVIEKARKLDPKDPEIKEELMRLRRQRRR
jgi:tetratricopeptide (TPR) repeat protein